MDGISRSRAISLLAEVLEAANGRFYQGQPEPSAGGVPTFDDRELRLPEKNHVTLGHGGNRPEYPEENLQPAAPLSGHRPVHPCQSPVLLSCLVSEALFKTIEKDIGIPVVSLTYDEPPHNETNLWPRICTNLAWIDEI